MLFYNIERIVFCFFAVIAGYVKKADCKIAMENKKTDENINILVELNHLRPDGLLGLNVFSYVKS